MMFTQDSPVEVALQLPEGRFYANVGFNVEQSVNPEHVLVAAQALLESRQSFVLASQAGVIVKAQELQVAFTDWSPLSVF